MFNIYVFYIVSQFYLANNCVSGFYEVGSLVEQDSIVGPSHSS